MLSLTESNWFEIFGEVNDSIKSTEIPIIKDVRAESESAYATMNFENIKVFADTQAQNGHEIDNEDYAQRRLNFKFVSNGEIPVKHGRSHKGKCGLCDGSNKSVKAYLCQLCEYVTVRRRDLRRHMDVVHFFKSTKYTKHNCSFCDFKSTKTLLEQHVKRMHPKEKNDTCYLCDNLAGHENLLNLHLADAHSVFKCNFCDHSADSKSHLRYHVNYQHLKSHMYICDVCCYATPNKKSLRLHIEDVHLRKKNYHCSFCDYSCTKNKYLQDHIENIHKKQHSYVCHICGLTLTRKNNLNFHIKSIHSECAEKTFKCEECDYSTWKKSDLTRHIKLRHLKMKL